MSLDQDASFTVDSFPGQLFKGRVVQVRQAPQVIQNVVTYDTVIAVPNPDFRLKPGMTANVKILVARREDALLVPNAAFRARVDDGKSSAAARPARPSGGSPLAMAPPPMMAGTGRGPETGRQVTPGSKQRLWVMEAGKPAMRTVQIGLSDGQKTEILEGLSEGDAVIVGQGNGSTSGPSGPSGPGGPRLRL